MGTPAGVKDFQSGAVLTDTDLNDYLMAQVTPVFDDATARDAAMTSPAEGQFAYLKDVDQFTYYSGSSWINYKADISQLAAPVTNRNLIYNGAMQVHQRGTSTASVTATGYYTADRWNTLVTSLGTWTQTVENDAPTGSGFRKSLKMLCTTADSTPAAGDVVLFDQRLEGQDVQRIKKGTSAAEQLTISFWVKSNVTGTYIIFLQDFDNSRSASKTYTINASGTWEKKTITFPADTTGALDNDNSPSLACRFVLGAGTDWTSGTLNETWAAIVLANLAVGQTNLAAATNNYWQITGVQLEVGNTATGFEFESFETTLAKCQRYYYRLFPGDSNKALFDGFVIDGTRAIGLTTFPTTMRARPTALEQNGTASHYAVAHQTSNTVCSAVPIYESLTTIHDAVTLFTVASGLTGGQGCFGRTDLTNGATAYLAWSAEL